jgi:MerR family transcriptional regulator/heat shock protein HspR
MAAADESRPVRSRVGRDRGVYMISVAAELAEMHPQTLRIYESRGLITPKRSPKNTRLYSQEDVDRLRRIQELTSELGMNLAGVERVFELEQELARVVRRAERLEREALETRRALEAEREDREREREMRLRAEERERRAQAGEMVRYEPRGQALVPVRQLRAEAVRLRLSPRSR